VAWKNDPDKRRLDREHYQHPEYVRNRPVVLRRAGGRCEQCGRRALLQVDHKTPLAILVDHSLANLWALCGPCHAAKTARDSHAARRAERPAPRPRTVW
jgi:5-methylcytosine-specific restriction endonuclease McrA